MTDQGYVPQAGDRVRVVIEGTVSEDLGRKLEIKDRTNWYHQVDLDGDVSIERLCDPLPTTPGSVIRRLGMFIHLSADGKRWVDDDGDTYLAALGIVADSIEHDAGKETV